MSSSTSYQDFRSKQSSTASVYARSGGILFPILTLFIFISREALMIHELIISDCCNYGPGSLEWVEIKHEADYHLHHVKSLNLNSANLLVRYQTSKGGINILFRYPKLQLGSVNGLICSYDPYETVYILNPLLEEYMILPKPQLKKELYSYGFGVSLVGEYKVIFCSRRISFVTHYELHEVEIEVHTLGTDRWRLLGQTPHNLDSIEEGPGVFLNSHVYWLGDDQIYDFDLTTETFELLSSPPGDNGESKETLGVLNGRLSRISWVMKETSWYKERAIQENISPILKSQPLCLIDGLKGTGILILHDEATKELVMYCLKTNTVLHRNLRPYNNDLSS